MNPHERPPLPDDEARQEFERNPAEDDAIEEDSADTDPYERPDHDNRSEDPS